MSKTQLNKNQKGLEIKPDELEVEMLYGYVDKEGNQFKRAVIREISGVEEEELGKPDIKNNAGRKINALLTGCVTRLIGENDQVLEREQLGENKWADIMRKLFLGDRDYLVLKIREFSFGDEMTIDSICPNCNNRLKVDFYTHEIEILPLNTDPFKIEFELPKGYMDAEGNIHTQGFMRLPNGKDQEIIDPIARRNEGIANTTLIARCVQELGDVKVNPQVFRKLSSKDREYLIKTLADVVFGPRFILNVDCVECGRSFETGVHPINFI